MPKETPPKPPVDPSTEEEVAVIALGGQADTDAAVAAANAAFPAQLLAAEELGDGTHSWRVKQGYEMGRPSQIDLSADVLDGAINEVRVGGEVFSDAMGAPGSYEGTYLGMIDHNATVISSALGGTAPERGMTGQLSVGS